VLERQFRRWFGFVDRGGKFSLIILVLRTRCGRLHGPHGDSGKGPLKAHRFLRAGSRRRCFMRLNGQRVADSLWLSASSPTILMD